ncbi:hypothetical protein [Vibrio bathopelagicus]
MNKNHDKTLTELPEFRWAFGGLLLLSAILFLVIAYNSDLKWQFDYEGFNFFVKAFSVPIAVLTSIIPIVGFIALNHRSVQTKEQLAKSSKQIELVQEQNLFTNYYKHIEEFEKFMKSKMELEKDYLYQTFNVRLVYKNLHLHSKKGSYEPVDLVDMDELEPLSDLLKAVSNLLGCGFLTDADSIEEQESEMSSAWPIVRGMLMLQMRVFSRVGYSQTSPADISFFGNIEYDNRHKFLVGSMHSLVKTLIHYNEIIFFSSSHSVDSPYMNLHRNFLYFISDEQHHINPSSGKEDFHIDISLLEGLVNEVIGITKETEVILP